MASVTRKREVERLQGEYDEKTERWMEGERGQAAQEFINEWENLEFEEIDFDVVEEIEVDPSHRDDLESAPDSVE